MRRGCLHKDNTCIITIHFISTQAYCKATIITLNQQHMSPNNFITPGKIHPS